MTSADRKLPVASFAIPQANGATNRIKIGLDQSLTKRNAPSRGIENIGTAGGKQLSEIEQTLPQARLGMRFEPSGPKQLAQIVPVNWLIPGETQHREQRTRAPVRNRNLLAVRRSKLKWTEQRGVGRWSARAQHASLLSLSHLYPPCANLFLIACAWTVANVILESPTQMHTLAAISADGFITFGYAVFL